MSQRHGNSESIARLIARELRSGNKLKPCEPWLSKVPGTDIYAVVGPDGRDIGFVRKFFRTIEKDVPGERYIAWRRTAKTPSWRYWLKGESEPRGSYALTRDTRKQAVTQLLRDYAIAMETGTAIDREAGVVAKP